MSGSMTGSRLKMCGQLNQEYYSFPWGFWNLTLTQHPILACWGHSDPCGSDLVALLPPSRKSQEPGKARLSVLILPWFPQALCRVFYSLSSDDDEIAVRKCCYWWSVCYVPDMACALSSNLNSILMENLYSHRVKFHKQVVELRFKSMSFQS